MSETASFEDYALSYALRGLEVFPLRPNSKEPLGGRGHLDATADEKQAEIWWKANPTAGIGYRPGDGEVIVDVDPRNGGEASFEDLVRRLGPLPPTVTTLTGGGGSHYRFRIPANVALPKTLARGVDLKGRNGYVVLPPSVHPTTGKAYAWAPYCDPEEQSVAELPAAWLTEFRRQEAPLTAKVQQLPEVIHEGEGRDNWLTSIAGSLRNRGLDETEILGSIKVLNESRCSPPLPKRDLARIANSIGNRQINAGHLAVVDEDDQPPPLKCLVVSIADFLAEKSESAPSLLGEGVICPGTLNILAGDDGTGKTMLALNLSLSLAAGRDFLGLRASGPASVLFVEAEGNESHFRNRLSSVASSLELDPAGLQFRTVKQPDLFQIDGPVLRAAIETYSPGLVVLDTVGYFFEGEENSASDWKNRVTKPLRKLGREFGVAFLVIQHLGKQNENRSGKARIRGSSAQSGDSDTVLTLDRSKANPDTDRILSFEKVKNGPKLAPKVLRFDEPRALFSLTDEDAVVATQPRLGDVQQIVLAAGRIRRKELIGRVKSAMALRSDSQAESLIDEAYGLGLVGRPERGIYGPPQGVLEFLASRPDLEPQSPVCPATVVAAGLSGLSSEASPKARSGFSGLSGLSGEAVISWPHVSPPPTLAPDCRSFVGDSDGACQDCGDPFWGHRTGLEVAQ